jgi:hypothetical protein
MSSVWGVEFFKFKKLLRAVSLDLFRLMNVLFNDDIRIHGLGWSSVVAWYRAEFLILFGASVRKYEPVCIHTTYVSTVARRRSGSRKPSLKQQQYRRTALLTAKNCLSLCIQPVSFYLYH